MFTQDPFEITVRHLVPLAAAILSGLLLVPACGLALMSPMAMDGGASPMVWLVVLLLIAQPPMLATATVAGCLCYRRFSKSRFVVAVAPPALAICAMKFLTGG